MIRLGSSKKLKRLLAALALSFGRLDTSLDVRVGIVGARSRIRECKLEVSLLILVSALVQIWNLMRCGLTMLEGSC